MKLYIKQKVFSFRDKFYVKDEYGEDKYYVEGELFSFGKKLHIYNLAGNELALVHQKVLSFMPKFTVEINNTTICEIVKKLTLFKPKYMVNGLGWDVEGDIFAHDYVITSCNRSIVSIHKQWMTWGDTFELDIDDNENEIVALGVVLAIDTVLDANNN